MRSQPDPDGSEFGGGAEGVVASDRNGRKGLMSLPATRCAHRRKGWWRPVRPDCTLCWLPARSGGGPRASAQRLPGCVHVLGPPGRQLQTDRPTTASMRACVSWSACPPRTRARFRPCPDRRGTNHLDLRPPLMACQWQATAGQQIEPFDAGHAGAIARRCTGAGISRSGPAACGKARTFSPVFPRQFVGNRGRITGRSKPSEQAAPCLLSALCRR